jgi:hypothetical protein
MPKNMENEEGQMIQPGGHEVMHPETDGYETAAAEADEDPALKTERRTALASAESSGVPPKDSEAEKLKLEKENEIERAAHEKVLEQAEKDLEEIKSDFNRKRQAVIDALNDPVLSRYAAAQKKDVKTLLRELPGPKSIGSVFKKLVAALDGTGDDPGRDALHTLDKARQNIADRLEKIDLATKVIKEKAMNEDGLSLAERKRRYEARSGARIYDKREGKLLKDLKDFRADVYSFCNQHEIDEAKRFLDEDEEQKMAA